MTSASWYSWLLGNPFPCLWARPSHLLLRTNVRQKCWGVTFKIMLQKTDFVLLFSSLLSPSSHLSCLLPSMKLLCCDLPLEAHVARKHKRSLDINSLGVEDLGPTTCEELNPGINHVSALGGRPFPN